MFPVSDDKAITKMDEQISKLQDDVKVHQSECVAMETSMFERIEYCLMTIV